jgi:C-terminal processing protease CtpA/Prc
MASEPLARSRSDDDGAFALDGLPPEDVPIRASHPGAGTSEVLRVRVRAREVIPGAILRLPERFDPERAAAEGGPGRQSGVSLTLRLRNDAVVITRLPSDGAAAQAGLARGDVILTIDGEDVLSVGQARGMLRGPAGTEVLVEVRRAGRDRVIPVTRESY